MKRKTVNICYQKSGNEFYIFKGVSSYPFGRIYDLLFFKILNKEQNKYVEDNKHSQSFTTNLLRLSISQFIELYGLIKPEFRNMNAFEKATEYIDKLKIKVKSEDSQSVAQAKAK